MLAARVEQKNGTYVHNIQTDIQSSPHPTGVAMFGINPDRREGGFLPKPARIPTNVPFNPLLPLKSSLVVAPAERPDILIDFSAHRGKSIILFNDAPAPFPVGDPRNDYFPGWNIGSNTGANPVNGATPPGFGPNSRVLMRFDVGTTVTSPADLTLTINTGTDLSGGIDTPVIPFGVSVPPPGVPVRQLSLNETFDPYGRLIQMLGTLVPPGSPSAGFGRAYTATATEVVKSGTTEVWEIFNTTADVHPMHFHLVNVQVINRQPFQVSSLGSTKGGVNFTGPATPAEPNETGWKETVMMFPGTVTRIIMRFDLPTVPFTVPPSTRFPGIANANEYVWHCHILEHEEHDMMRPLVVTS
jgi:spore coat protein A, manganese oxidase